MAAAFGQPLAEVDQNSEEINGKRRQNQENWAPNKRRKNKATDEAFINHLEVLSPERTTENKCRWYDIDLHPPAFPEMYS